MSEIKNESGVEGEEAEIDLDAEEGEEIEGGEKPKEKVEETPEAKRARLQRMLDQHNKKFPTDKTEKKVEVKKSEDLGYAEKAFLVSNGIKGKDEVDLVKDIMSATGKSLDDVLESRHFQAELKDLRDEKASKDAIPKGTKRSGNSASDEVGYWLAKGELPPADQRELRTKVVNARIKTQKDNNVFTKTPVAGK